jgi:hypothetical protein
VPIDVAAATPTASGARHCLGSSPAAELIARRWSGRRSSAGSATAGGARRDGGGPAPIVELARIDRDDAVAARLGLSSFGVLLAAPVELPSAALAAQPAEVRKAAIGQLLTDVAAAAPLPAPAG